LIGFAVAGYLFAPQLIALFRDDPDVIACGTAALRFQCISFPLHGWIVMSTMMEQSMGKTTSATFLSVARQGLFFIPLVLTLSALFGLIGIQITQACADVLTFLCAVPIHLYVMKGMQQQKH